MQSMILCCGEALIDMIPRSGAYQPCPGGCSYNTAIAASRLGASVTFLGRISTDFFGELLVRRLTDNTVDTGLIVRSRENTTLAFVKLEEGKEPAYAFYTEGTADRSLSPTDLPPALPREVRCLQFGSISLTMEPVASTIERLVLREHRRTDPGAPVISIDPNVRPFMIADQKAYVKRFEGWIGASNIAKISAADFEFIYPGLELEDALRTLLDMGPTLALTTLGPEGALALLKRGDGSIIRVTAPVVPVTVVDTIGAGDTFHGALLSWLERQGKMSRPALAALTETELRDALVFANKAASLVCARKGAEPPTLDETESL
jgi:fructokinase